MRSVSRLRQTSQTRLDQAGANALCHARLKDLALRAASGCCPCLTVGLPALLAWLHICYLEVPGCKFATSTCAGFVIFSWYHQMWFHYTVAFSNAGNSTRGAMFDVQRGHVLIRQVESSLLGNTPQHRCPLSSQHRLHILIRRQTA